MDWTEYPIALPVDALVDDVADLSAFLGVDQIYLEAVVYLAAQVQAVPDGEDRLARGFPRETVAWRTWQAYTPTPTAGELRDACAAVPDPAPEDPGMPLLPLILRRLQVTGRPDGGATVNLSARVDTASPWRDTAWSVPAPALEVDPALLGATPPAAAVSIRLTVQEQQQ